MPASKLKSSASVPIAPGEFSQEDVMHQLTSVHPFLIMEKYLLVNAQLNTRDGHALRLDGEDAVDVLVIAVLIPRAGWVGGCRGKECYDDVAAFHRHQPAGGQYGHDAVLASARGGAVRS